jgi:hypothetical protein
MLHQDNLACQESEDYILKDKKNVPPFAIPNEAFEVFAALAKSEGKTFSQAIRDAMAEYSEKRGQPIDFNVGQWGGYREPSSDSAE